MYVCMYVCMHMYVSWNPQTKFEEQVSIGETHNHAKFRHPLTSGVRDIRCLKFMLPEKWITVHEKTQIRENCGFSPQILAGNRT